MMNDNTNPDKGNKNRPLTIASNGQIVTKPYGRSRWHNPARRPCAHEDCDGVAKVLKPAGTHENGTGPEKAHNCCNQH